MMLTQERLKRLMTYNPETGEFIWRVRWHRSRPGDKVGRSLNVGYYRITIDGKHYYLHQLAFLFMEDRIPTHDIDHKNGDKIDNRWDNLRVAGKQGNQANSPMKSTNTSGFKGVSFCATTKRWRASIRHNGREINLGRYNTKEEAAKAYEVSSVRLFGEFAYAARVA